MRLLVTGGAGFIGSTLIRHLLAKPDIQVTNIDALAYAGSHATIADFIDHPRHHFCHADIGESKTIQKVLNDFCPHAIFNLAAQTHVDRSIDGPSPFIETNIVATYRFLEATRDYWKKLPTVAKDSFRFIHVSTDEVYGDIALGSTPAGIGSPYHPSSPYAASKAASDHLVSAWQRTYDVPTIISNCTNNYGPYQLPEKLIPLVIEAALADKPLPIYGDGQQIRDWLYVEDHVRALVVILQKGVAGGRYHIAGGTQTTNLELVRQLCQILDKVRIPQVKPGHHENLIQHVDDRPGHDRRYALDDSATREGLRWVPRETLSSGLHKTIQWYLGHTHWRQQVFIAAGKGNRMGVNS